MTSREMQKALEADGEKLRQMTGRDHGPRKLTPEEERLVWRALMDSSEHCYDIEPSISNGEITAEKPK